MQNEEIISLKDRIVLLKSENVLMKSDIRKNATKYNKLLRAFNELLDEYIIELQRRGEDTDGIREDYFVKANILD